MNFTVHQQREQLHHLIICYLLNREAQSRAASGRPEAGQGPTGH